MAKLISSFKEQFFPIAQKVYVKIAFVALLIANAVSWLGHFDEVRKFVLRFFSFDDWLLGHFLIAGIVAAALLLGYAILAFWVYKSYFETATRKNRIFFGGATVFGVIAIVCLNFWLIVPASP